MGKLVIGANQRPLSGGLSKYFTPFNIDNDSFPTLINAYQTRGRVKRKRGTAAFTQLMRYVSFTNYPSYDLLLNLEPNSSILPGSVVIVGSGGTTWTDNGLGVLVRSGGGSNASINYATGLVTPNGSGSPTLNFTSATFNYFPDLPVMGIRDFEQPSSNYPSNVFFDTTYAYEVQSMRSAGTIPYLAYDVSFYKNLPTGTYTGYVAKSTPTPLTWNGQNYQQFGSVNYQGAFWATNGVPVSFSGANIGMQFQVPTVITVLTTKTVEFTIGGNPLQVGDFVFINEVIASGTGNAQAINFQTGFVTTAGNSFIVTFPNANIPAGTYSGGIVQYLTNRSSTTKDCIRWYDGDPTNSSALAPSYGSSFGWVNYMPPLSLAIYSIADLPEAQYYLVGAKIVTTYKDRILFIGPVIQSSTGSPIYLKDTVVFSQNGTPYYTASFTGDPSLPTTSFMSLLVPNNQSATASAMWEDQTGFGGWISSGFDQTIATSSPNQDALILGALRQELRLVYTGNDLIPFNFYLINSEYGSTSTFSAINFDEFVLTRGSRGYIRTNQVSCGRFDIIIPDEVFEINQTNNGTERVTAIRDYINEWVYFTYVSDESDTNIYIYPNETLFYNYRDNTFAIFYECYTTYGTVRQTQYMTWGTVGQTFPSWSVWNEPWNAGDNQTDEPLVIGGNQQGFIVIKGEGTGEAPSLLIQSMSGVTIIANNHQLNAGDFIQITNCIGTIGQLINGFIYEVSLIQDVNTFQVSSPVPVGTYIGGGLITRFYVPIIQTKQFPMAWEMGRKTRIGVQQYLLSTTPNSQITLYIYLSQDASDPYNDGPIGFDSSLIYSTILYTCPESTNLGLTPANINLQTPTASSQAQIWHRLNTSLIGDTVQLGFTMTTDQMLLQPTAFGTAITGASNADPCVLNCTAQFAAGTLIQIAGVQGMTQLNYDTSDNNYYYVLSSTTTTVSINVDSSDFDDYTSGGTATPVGITNQTAEIELHSCILELQPSQLLV